MVERPLVPAPLARGARGAVVAPHHLATEAGLAILRSGGHAVDAAIATNAVLAVVMPNACGLGGDAFWLVWSGGRLTGLNGSGRAGAGASAEELRRGGHSIVPHRGPLSVTVPGAVRSWRDAHDRFGRLALAEVLGPAIELARDGFPAWDGFIEAVERTLPLAETPSIAGRFAARFRANDRPWRPGERVRFPALARTLERLASVGLDDFYEGEVAAAQARALEDAGAAVTATDLAAHSGAWTEPIAIDYRGTTVASHRPNSSGIVGLEILGLLARFEPPPRTAFAARGCEDPGWIHLGIEAAKLAMEDRDRELADPDHLRRPIEALIDGARLDGLAAGIDRAHASRPEPTVRRREGTIFLGVVDADGNAVSLIESNYSGFGSLVVDLETGIHYQNRGSFFSLDPASPNVLAPGKRPLHTLLPAMLLRDGRPWVVLGSMGGDAQPQILGQLVSALVDGAVDVATAVAAPRWFVEPPAHFARPIDVRIEPRFDPGVVAGLLRLGHPVSTVDPFDGLLGHAHAIELVEGGPAAGGTLAAATDPRSNGLPATW